VRRITFFLLAALVAVTPVTTRAGVKYVAVVESDIDAASGASATLTSADVRLVTAELRREAVNNLPRDKYNIMTSETVQSMGGAVLEECSEENCVIALGSKIGADYIVRGTVSKVQTMLTLTVEMYETDNGTLMASSNPVRAETIVELLEKAATASAAMYKTFVNTQNALTIPASPVPQQPPPEPPAPPAPQQQPPPPPPATYTVSAAANPNKGGSKKLPKPKTEIEPTAERRPTTGFSLGVGFSSSHTAFQLGVAHSRPVSGNGISINAEGNIQIGRADYPDGEGTDIVGLNVPLTVLLQLSVFSLEAGVHGDVLFGDDETVFNA